MSIPVKGPKLSMETISGKLEVAATHPVTGKVMFKIATIEGGDALASNILLYSELANVMSKVAVVILNKELGTNLKLRNEPFIRKS